MNETSHPYFREINFLHKELKQAGFIPRAVFDGGETVSTETWKQVIETVLSVDESTIHLFDNKGNRVWIFIVLGNEPGVACCDYSGNSPALDTITETVYNHFN